MLLVRSILSLKEKMDEEVITAAWIYLQKRLVSRNRQSNLILKTNENKKRDIFFPEAFFKNPCACFECVLYSLEMIVARHGSFNDSLRYKKKKWKKNQRETSSKQSWGQGGAVYFKEKKLLIPLTSSAPSPSKPACPWVWREWVSELGSFP